MKCVFIHPKWRDKHDLIGSVLLGRRGVLSAESEAPRNLRHMRSETEEEELYVYDSADIREQQKRRESGGQNALSQCEGQEGIAFGWHFVGRLFGGGGREAMGEAWKFLFTGHRDLRRYVSEVDFADTENTCRYLRRALHSRDVMRKSGMGGDDGGKVDVDALAAGKNLLYCSVGHGGGEEGGGDVLERD